RGEYPDTLVALADKRYVQSIPVDPFTKAADTWTLVQSDDPDHPGIKDIHSGAAEVAANGTPFATWCAPMRAPSTRQGGLAYLGLLAAVVLVGLVLTWAARVW